MKPYRLLILGHVPPNGTWQTAAGVYAMVTQGIIEPFAAMGHVNVEAARVLDFIKAPKKFHLPQADVVIVTAFCGEEPTLAEVRNATGAKKVVSFREIPADYDHSFIFAQPNDFYRRKYKGHYTTFKLPCCKRLMVNKPKVPSSILVDHTWHVEDHTEQIEGWLEGYTKGPVYRLLRPGSENFHPVPSWMKTVCYRPYPEYLDATATFERHIVTHIEGYGFGVVDFAARGTQVISWPDMLPSDVEVDLDIPVFYDKTELLGMLDLPVGRDVCKIDKCTDYGTIARAMDKQFQEWLA